MRKLTKFNKLTVACIIVGIMFIFYIVIKLLYKFILW
jgi:hypothetical protein